MKTKIWIFALGAMLASNSLLAQDESDDMYFFTTDRKEKVEVPKGDAVADSPSAIAKFDENSDYSVESTNTGLETSYKPTYSLYNTDYTAYQNGFSPRFYSRNTRVVLSSSQGFRNSNWNYVGQDGWGNDLYYNPNRIVNNTVVVGNTWGNTWSGNSNIGFGTANSWGGSSNVGIGNEGGFSNSNSGYYCPPSQGVTRNIPAWTSGNTSATTRPSRSSSNTIATRGNSSVRSGRGGVSSIASRTSFGNPNYGTRTGSSNSGFGGSRSSYSSGSSRSSGSSSFSSGASRSSSSTVRTPSSSSSSSGGGRSSSCLGSSR